MNVWLQETTSKWMIIKLYCAARDGDVEAARNELTSGKCHINSVRNLIDTRTHVDLTKRYAYIL